ncbi:uncharacterized protein LOC101213388 [Cucumis sativus]|uniref:uncharacterized protein LOC101213388 n=1 Tax=Cucumis sativus TaxID=3659 RepID=UPI0002B46C17|nr:uncharacterized protein LOC101213388 [Cucumis sativus]KGN44664.2 hypothetical protein Csa_016603 [Cucumis sativus]
MGSRRKKKRTAGSEDPSSSSPSSSDDSDSSSMRSRRHYRSDSSRREKDKERESRIRDRERKRKDRNRERDRKRRKKKLRRESKRKKDDYGSESDNESSHSGNSVNTKSDRRKVKIKEPEVILRQLLKDFPDIGNDLKQLLKMIDDGQAVDISGISVKCLTKRLKTLFVSLNLEESQERVFLLPSSVRPTLEVIGPLIEMHMDQKSKPVDDAITLDDKSSPPLNMEATQAREDNMSELAYPDGEASGPKRRMLGPEMPSAELLAAAAKLTEAQTELREVELEEDDELFVGPPPPAMVAEAETANEAERFEEVSRIMDVEGDSPYDILGLNRNLSIENIKKRYWKMSLLVHPDKCSHPHANQAFIRLNNAFKELQDPDKRKALDDKIKFKEEQEQFKVELRGMREAAKWRKSQGISMEGDEELLANMDDEVTAEPKRDEWMTNLPPERKPGMTMQSSRFSKSSKESRGDTSVWTDTPSDRAQKAKMSYLEAYNEAAALASNEEAKKYSAESALVDKYNQEKRSKSLVEKHREGVKSRGKKKLKQVVEKEDEWVGKHPWKPWDREKDLTAGRKSINFDPENMAQGLGSRFSSGSYQRNFL